MLITILMLVAIYVAPLWLLKNKKASATQFACVYIPLTFAFVNLAIMQMNGGTEYREFGLPPVFFGVVDVEPQVEYVGTPAEHVVDAVSVTNFFSVLFSMIWWLFMLCVQTVVIGGLGAVCGFGLDGLMGTKENDNTHGYAISILFLVGLSVVFYYSGTTGLG
jgi:hypothetical protein